MPVLVAPLVWDSSHQLTQNNEIDYNSSSQKAVLADIVADKSVLSSHKDFTGVFVNGFFGVSSARNILNDDCMIWVLLRVSWVVKQRVVKNVFNAFRFWCLFWFELFLWGQVFAVIVA